MLYYYRDKDQAEIDLLIVKDGIIYPLEIKKTAAPTKHSVKHFYLLEKLGLKIGQGGVICLVKDLFPITHNVNAIPIGLL